MHPILTAGYNAGWTPASLLATVIARGAVLVDIRMNPTSTRPEWRKDQLKAVFNQLYRHEPALGNKNYKGGPIELAAPERSLMPMRALLLERPIVLLCACRDAASCHRSEAADFLALRLQTTVEHLDPPVETRPGAIPAISLTPPWGTLVAIADPYPELGKHIETRSWRTQYRGPIAIHQTKGHAGFETEDDLWRLCASEPFKSSLVGAGLNKLWHLPRGSVIATAYLAGCIATDTLVDTKQLFHKDVNGHPQFWDLTDRERAFGDYTPGRWAWLLSDIRKLPEHVPTRGQAGLWWWTPPAEVRR